MKIGNQKFDFISAFSDNKLLAGLAMFIISCAGLAALFYGRQEVYPNSSPETITVTVSYPGASPEDIERAIILAVEDTVAGLENVEKITSTADENLATIVIEMRKGADIQKLATDVKMGIDRITSFPSDAEEPHISVSSDKVKVMEFCLYADISQREMYELSETLRDDFLRTSGITALEVFGNQKPEISVEIPMENLRRYGLSINDIADKLRSNSLELPAGTIYTDGGDILVRIKDRRDYGKEFESLPIIVPQAGAALTLSDIGKVIDGFDDDFSRLLWNGKRAVFFKVYNYGDFTPKKISKLVKNFIANYRKKLPTGVSMEITMDSSDEYLFTSSLLLKSGVYGWVGILIFFALFFERRMAFWLALTLPASILGVIAIFAILGKPISLVLFFSLSILIVLLMSCAVNISESIQKLKEKGISWKTSSLEGSRFMFGASAILAISSILLFSPIYFADNVVGKFYYPLFLAVVIGLPLSVFVSVFILPLKFANLCGNKAGLLSGRFLNSVKTAYSNALTKFFLPHRYIFASLFFGIASVMLSLLYSGKIRTNIFPVIEGEYVKATINLPFDAPFSDTENCALFVAQKAQELVAENGNEHFARGVKTCIFKSTDDKFIGTYYAEVRIYLTLNGTSKISSDEIIKSWKTKVGEVLGVSSIVYTADSESPVLDKSISVSISHKNLEILKIAAKEIKESLLKYHDVLDVDDGILIGKDQLNIKILDEAKTMGFSVADVAKQLRGAFYGTEAMRQQRGREEIKIMVRLPESERCNESTLDKFTLIDKNGNTVMFSEVVDIDRADSFTSIQRENLRRIITVKANLSSRLSIEAIAKSLEDDIFPNLENKYAGLSAELSGKYNEIHRGLADLALVFALCFAIVFCLMSLYFNSYVGGLIFVISSLASIVCILITHLIFACQLTFLGVASGIIVLLFAAFNALLFHNETQKKSLFEKDSLRLITTAAVARLRPILLISVMTIIIFTPIMFEFNHHLKFLQQVLLCLSAATFLTSIFTMIVLPISYMIVFDIKKIFKIKG